MLPLRILVSPQQGKLEPVPLLVTLWVWFFTFNHFLSSFTLQILAEIKDTHVLISWSITAVCPPGTCGFLFSVVLFEKTSCCTSQAACRAQHVINTQSTDLKMHREMRLLKLFLVKGSCTSNEISPGGRGFDCDRRFFFSRLGDSTWTH